MKTNYIYIVYKTTNLSNNKIYIGVHKQSNFQFDGYIGSGKNLLKAKIKYGEDSFKREILYFYYSEKVAYKREKLLVTKEFIRRPDTYNMKVGGKGGWDHCNNVYTKIKVQDTLFRKYGSNYGKLHYEETQTKSQATKFKLYGNACGHMHNQEIRSKINLTRSLSGYNYISPCHTEESRKKAMITKKLNGTDNCDHLKSEDIIAKAKLTRRLNGNNDMRWCLTDEAKKKSQATRRFKYGSANGQMRTPEAKLKILESRKSNSLNKYPELLLECEVIDLATQEIKHKGSILDLSIILYTETRAVQKHKQLINKLDSGIPFKSGKWKGYLINKVIRTFND